MPTYRVKDSATGVTLDLTGDSPPTSDELASIFSQANHPAPAISYESPSGPLPTMPPAEDLEHPEESNLEYGLRIPQRVLGQGLGLLGKLGLATGGDIAAGMRALKTGATEASQFSGNIPALFRDEPLPIQSALEEGQKDVRERGGSGLDMVAARGAAGVLETLPKIAAGGALGGSSLLGQSIAFGGIFGLDEEGNFHPKEAAVAALMPSVMRLAGTATASGIAKAIESGAPLESRAAQNVIEVLGEQAALNAYTVATSSPELIDLYRKDPAAFKEQLTDIVGQNLAFSVLGLPRLTGIKPTHTEQLLLSKRDTYADAAYKRVLADQMAPRSTRPIVEETAGRPMTRPVTTTPSSSEVIVAPELAEVQKVSTAEPSTTAASALEVKPEPLGANIESARRIVEMTPAEFQAQAQDFNKINLELGRNATPEEYAELKVLRDRANTRMKEAIANGDLEAAAPLSVMPQFYNEAIKEYELTHPSNAPSEPRPVTTEAGAEKPPALSPDTPKSSTQLTLPLQDAVPFNEFAKSIPDSEVYHKADETGKEDYGIETEPHITVLYGLTQHEPEPVSKIAATKKPITVTLGKLSVFENKDYDVLKVDVKGDDLHALNSEISKLPNEQTFPEYQPHLTIAYLKKGEGKKYVGDTRFEGKTITFPSVTFSPPKELRASIGRPELPLGQQTTGEPNAPIPTQSPITSSQPTGPTAQAQAQRPVGEGGEEPIRVRDDVQPSAPQPPGGTVKADPIVAWLDSVIESTSVNRERTLEGVLGAPVWLAKDIVRTTAQVVRAAYLATKNAAQAVQAGLEWLRSQNLKDYNESEAKAWLEGGVQRTVPQPQAELASTEPAAQQQRTAEKAPDEVDVTQVSGKQVGILSKTKAPDAESQIAATEKAFADYGLPVEKVQKADTRIEGDPVKTQFRFKPDGLNKDIEGNKLADDLESELAKGDHANDLRLSNLRASIANSIANGDASVIGKDGRPMLSDAVQQRLFNLAQTLESQAGQVLALRGQHSFDPEGAMQIAHNVGVHLHKIWYDSYGGKQIDAVLTKVKTAFKELLTDKDVAAALVKELGLTGEQAANISELIYKALEGTEKAKGPLRRAREKALQKVQSELAPEERKLLSENKTMWQKIERAVRAGLFDTGSVLEELAKKEGWTIPTPEQKAQIKGWAEREIALRTPTQAEVERYGGVEKATTAVEKATEQERIKLIKDIQADWSRWSMPTGLRNMLRPEIAKNNAKAINEFVGANLLFKMGFAVRQMMDVGIVSMPLNAINRTLVHVLERASNEGGFSAATLKDLDAATKEMVVARISSLKATLREMERVATGHTNRRVLDRMSHSVGIFERMRVKADELEAKGNTAAARAMRAATVLQAGYRITATWDAIQSVGLEWQEMRQQLSTDLRKAGKSHAEIATQLDDIFSGIKVDMLQAAEEARVIGTERGLKKDDATLQSDAWRLIKAKAYDRMREATGETTDYAAENEIYRELHSWNLPETGGIGGLIAETIKGIRSKTEKAGVPTGGLFSFGNAMGIAANRMATFSGGGLFGGFGFGDSPWYQGERNIRQRRIEAMQGLAVIGTLVGLAAAGKIIVQTKYPDDKAEKERFIAEGHKLNTVRFISDDGQSWMEIPIQMSPFSFIASPIYMIGGIQRLYTDQHRDQERLNADAARTGATPGNAKAVGPGDVMGVLAQGLYGLFTGGRTAGGLVQSYSDYGNFNLNKSAAAFVAPYIPGIPAWQEAARMMGTAMDTRTATMLQLLVPVPGSSNQRINSLGDPLVNPNAVHRVLQVLSGGVGFGDGEDLKDNHAYQQIFSAGYSAPEPGRNKGYNFNGIIRPMTPQELEYYTVERGKAFKRELQSVNVVGLPEDQAHKIVSEAFQRAHDSALRLINVEQRRPRRSRFGPRGTSRSLLGGRTRRGSRRSSLIYRPKNRTRSSLIDSRRSFISSR